MLINIQANITDEECLILAKEQGWTENITINQIHNIDGTISGGDIIINPLTYQQYLKDIYRSIIIENATYNSIKYNERIHGKENINTSLIKEQISNNINIL